MSYAGREDDLVDLINRAILFTNEDDIDHAIDVCRKFKGNESFESRLPRLLEMKQWLKDAKEAL